LLFKENLVHDSLGPKNEPQYSGTGVPADAADLTEVAAYAAKVGNRRSGLDSVRTGLIGADVWDGLEFYSTDTAITWLYKGPSGSGAWVQTAGDTGWIAATLVNSWVNFGGAYMVAQYRRRNGIVQVEGLVSGGASVPGQTVFTLPAGFRPAAYIVRPVSIPGTATANIELGPVGNIVQGATGLSGTRTSLGFSFLADV
jgi:hypothetical protein